MLLLLPLFHYIVHIDVSSHTNAWGGAVNFTRLTLHAWSATHPCACSAVCVPWLQPRVNSPNQVCAACTHYIEEFCQKTNTHYKREWREYIWRSIRYRYSWYTWKKYWTKKTPCHLASSDLLTRKKKHHAICYSQPISQQVISSDVKHPFLNNTIQYM